MNLKVLCYSRVQKHLWIAYTTAYTIYKIHFYLINKMNVDSTCKTLFFCEKHFSWMLLLHEAMFHILILLFPITIVTNASLSKYETKYDRKVILKFLNLFLILTIHKFHFFSSPFFFPDIFFAKWRQQKTCSPSCIIQILSHTT